MMHRIVMALCGLLAALAWQTADAEQILLRRELEPAPDRGEALVRKHVNVQMPGATLRYRGLGPKEGNGEAIVEQYGDHFLGLYFGSPPRSNGGWSRWQFLRVWVRHGERTIAAERHMMLDDAYVLERQERRMVMLRWPLPSPDDGSASAQQPYLNVTFIEYPPMPEWLFLRVEVEGNDVEIESVRLSSYPGHTAGPEERQRWVAGVDEHLNLHDGPQTMPADVPGLVFYNRFAHQRAGCFLVPTPGETSTIDVRGTYAVSADFTAEANRRDMTFALGFFIDEDPDEAIRRFFTEWQPAAAAFMARIDWEPRFSWSGIDDLVNRIDAFMAYESDEQWVEQWAALKGRFHAAREDEAVTDAIGISEAMRAFKERLLQHRLDQWR